MRARVEKLINKSPKLLPEVKSQVDKLDDVYIEDDGTIVHNLFDDPKTNQPRTFKTIAHFSKWRKQRLAFKRKQFEDKLTPLQYFVT